MYGNPFADSASIGATPQATANKRCKNYSTCATNYTGLKSGISCQAATNVKILNAFLTKSTGNVEIIKEQIKVTYIQAALPDLNKIDNDMADTPKLEHREHQGEGYGFYKVGKAYYSAEADALLESLYTQALDTVITAPCEPSLV